jgi:hypothetical protein
VEKIMSLYETISTKLIECDLDSIEIFKHGSKYEVTFEWEDISFEFTFHERNKEPNGLCILTCYCYTNNEYYGFDQNVIQNIFKTIHNDKELYLEFKKYLKL